MNEKIINYIKKDCVHSINFFYYFNDDKILKPNEPVSACYEYLNRSCTYHSNDKFSEIIDGVEERLHGIRFSYPKIMPYYPYIAINLYNYIFSEDETNRLYEAFKYLKINATITDNIVIWKWEDYGSLFLKSTFLRLLLNNKEFRYTVFKIRDYYPTMSYLKSCILALYNVNIYDVSSHRWAHKTILDYNMYDYVKRETSFYSFIPIYPKSLSSLNLPVVTDIKTIEIEEYEYNDDDEDEYEEFVKYYPKEYTNLFNYFKLNTKINAKTMSEVVLKDYNFTLEQLDTLINFLETLNPYLNDDNRIRPRSFYTRQEQPVN
jgi:hypothetical protein